MPKRERSKIKKQIKKKVTVKKTAKSSTVENVKKKRKTAVSKNVKKKDSARNKPVKKTKKVNSQKTENNKEQDSYFAKWTSPEFIKTNEEMLFYYASIVGSILMIAWSFSQESFVAVTTFVIVIAVVVFQIYRKPLDVECKIDLDGIALNSRLHRYDEIDSFEVVQGNENNILKFKLKNAILPVKEVQLMDQDPYYIRATLEYFLPEKKQKEMLFDYKKKGNFGDDMSEEELDEYLEEVDRE